METPALHALSEFSELDIPLPCQACGCHAVFTAVAPQRIEPIYLRCCACGAERRDLAVFEDDLPRT